MPRHPFVAPKGRLWDLVVDSPRLANRLGDPTARIVRIYVPAEAEGATDLPLFVSLAAFTSSGLRQTTWRAFDESLPQRLDRLIAAGALGPVVLAMPDAFTSLGGNQYVDSPVLGQWSTALVADFLPAVEAACGGGGRRERRAVFGTSSGGYGALRQLVEHPEVWGAAACHAPDAGFEWVLGRELVRLCRSLGGPDGGVAGFLARIEQAARVSADDLTTLMLLACAASYDPDPAPEPGPGLGIRLPIDLATGRLDGAAWARWLAHDPVSFCATPRARAALERTLGLFIDVGARDEYFIDLGVRRLIAELGWLGERLAHTVFDGGHGGLEARCDHAWPWLYRRLMGATEAP